LHTSTGIVAGPQGTTTAGVNLAQAPASHSPDATAHAQGEVAVERSGSGIAAGAE